MLRNETTRTSSTGSACCLCSVRAGSRRSRKPVSLHLCLSHGTSVPVSPGPMPRLRPFHQESQWLIHCFAHEDSSGVHRPGSSTHERRRASSACSNRETTRVQPRLHALRAWSAARCRDVQSHRSQHRQSAARADCDRPQLTRLATRCVHRPGFRHLLRGVADSDCAHC